LKSSSINRLNSVYKVSGDSGALPTVNSLLSSKETDFKSRTWMTSTIRCSGKDKVTVLYWGGGNCKGCERAVQYRFSQEGKLEDAKLQ